MEHKFKLKKDGKTVGYLEIFAEDGEVVFRKDLIDDMDCDIWEQGICDFDTAHPFVTKDKNGKDIFAGDSLKSGKRIIKVVWDEEYLQWRAGEKDNPYFSPLCQWAITEQFELIKDEGNE
jgi:hypothetical protein